LAQTPLDAAISIVENDDPVGGAENEKKGQHHASNSYKRMRVKASA
jgi:hypothetical protein